jgi:hypothetical protein
MATRMAFVIAALFLLGFAFSQNYSVGSAITTLQSGAGNTSDISTEYDTPIGISEGKTGNYSFISESALSGYASSEEIAKDPVDTNDTHGNFPQILVNQSNNASKEVIVVNGTSSTDDELAKLEQEKNDAAIILVLLGLIYVVKTKILI